MGNVTKKQIVMLFIVAWILVIMVFVMYVFLPMFEEMNTADEDIEYAEQNYTVMMFNGAMTDVYRDQVEDSKLSISEALVPYYGIKRNAQIDNEILSIAAKNGIDAMGLSISEIAPFESFEEFGALKEKAEMDAESDFYDEEGYSDGESYEGESSDYDEFGNSGEEEESASSGFYYVSAEYSLKADYAEIINFIKDINAHDSFYLKNLSFSQSLEETPGSEEEAAIPDKLGEKMDVLISVIAFMHIDKV